jgi:hypothetical protein
VAESGLAGAPFTAEDQVIPTVVGQYASAAVTDAVHAVAEDLHSAVALDDAEMF